MHGNGRQLGAVVRRELDAEDASDGGSNLLGEERTIVRCLANGLYPFSPQHNPRSLGILGATAMSIPLVAATAPVVAGQEIGRLAAIERVRLTGFVDIADECVVGVGGIKIEIIFVRVGPLVSVAEGNPHHLGMVVDQRL